MVRRSAATNFGPFIKKLTKEQIKEEFLPTFDKLASDDQDSVRLLTVEGCVAIASMFTFEENTSLILPLVRNAINDKSWRVRYMAATHFCEV